MLLLGHTATTVSEYIKVIHNWSASMDLVVGLGLRDLSGSQGFIWVWPTMFIRPKHNKIGPSKRRVLYRIEGAGLVCMRVGDWPHPRATQLSSSQNLPGPTGERVFYTGTKLAIAS